MKEDVKTQLDVILDTYNRKLEERKKTIEKVRRGEEAFLKEFQRRRDQVIHPVMEEIGRQLKERGHDYSIEKDEMRITMDIYPSELDRSEYSPGSTPTISFHAIRYKKKVMIYGSNIMPKRGGSGGPRGEFDIDQINNDFVTQEILKVLKEIFVRSY